MGIVTKKLAAGWGPLVASFSHIALLLLPTKLLLFGHSFGKGGIEPHFVERRHS